MDKENQIEYDDDDVSYVDTIDPDEIIKEAFPENPMDNPQGETQLPQGELVIKLDEESTEAQKEQKNMAFAEAATPDLSNLLKKKTITLQMLWKTKMILVK
ncbi:MAG: hypothetical protein LBB20_02390 [Puniceicoccales bacterium]|jgi:hypothetical protein|nr:hypothetical protein [Puniceicoccales bacterium]